MRRDFNKKQLDEVTTKINDKIEEIKSNVLIKVTQSLENELEKIESLIENFEGAEFHSNKIEKYRNELIKHVENGFRDGILSAKRGQDYSERGLAGLRCGSTGGFLSSNDKVLFKVRIKKQCFMTNRVGFRCIAFCF